MPQGGPGAAAERLLKADPQALGDFLFKKKRWAEAAEAYAAALKADPTVPALLYLRGVALQRAGDKGGAALVGRAKVMPLADDEALYFLSQRLDTAGLPDEAAGVRRVAVRVGKFGGVYIVNAASALANWASNKGRHAESGLLYRQMVTDVAFGDAGSFVSSRAYLLVPAWGHMGKARGLAAAGEPERALAEARLFWMYLPEDKAFVPDIVRAFEKAGKADEADRLFAEQFGLCQRACVETPNRADRHNRLAWLAARCGRRLDTALTHAKRAVALTPDNAQSLDTLSEVYFQRGEKSEALEANGRAIKLAPDRAYLLAQRKRIEAGDPKAELPPR